MAEKGGKRFVVPTAKKVTVSEFSGKKDDSLKGRDGSSSKARGTVQFESSDSEGSPIINGKMSSKAWGKVSSGTPVTSKDWGKGGKDDRMGKSGGKGTTMREPVVQVNIAEVAFKNEELPKNAKCLIDCEAAVILQGVQEHLTVLSEDSAIKMPDSFLSGLEYAKTGSDFTNAASVREALFTLKRSKVSDGELCMIGNFCPETVDEVYALAPSLKGNRLTTEGPIKDVLYELAKYKPTK